MKEKMNTTDKTKWANIRMINRTQGPDKALMKVTMKLNCI